MSDSKEANIKSEPAGVGSLPFASATMQPSSSPAASRVRVYFAPVARDTGTPTFFDGAASAAFDFDNPPSPWVDLGWIADFSRKSESKFVPVLGGSPPVVQTQVRQLLASTVSFRFLSWGKLQMSLATGSEQLNLLEEASGATGQPAGGSAVAAVTTEAGSTATALVLSDLGAIATGSIVAVDADYQGQTGYVGSGAAGGYVTAAMQKQLDVDYIRRVTLNVARVIGVSKSTVLLASPLLAGAPPAGTGVQAVAGFADREGGAFFQVWSALFALQGVQGDVVFYHYPRLQTIQGATESEKPLSGDLASFLLNASFRALPITDSLDGASVVCYRSYIPAAMMNIS